MPAEGPKYTPGPWERYGMIGDGDLRYIRAITGPPKLACKSPEYEYIGKCEKGANARLIAASPALLAACEAAVEAMNSLDGSIYEENDLISESGKQLEAAIKAAKGTG